MEIQLTQTTDVSIDLVKSYTIAPIRTEYCDSYIENLELVDYSFKKDGEQLFAIIKITMDIESTVHSQYGGGELLHQAAIIIKTDPFSLIDFTGEFYYQPEDISIEFINHKSSLNPDQIKEISNLIYNKLQKTRFEFVAKRSELISDLQISK